jgi:hypothetical protein
VRVVLKSYNLSTHELLLDLTEQGKVIGHAVMIFVPSGQMLFSPKEQNKRYHRRATGDSRSLLAWSHRPDSCSPSRRKATASG